MSFRKIGKVGIVDLTWNWVFRGFGLNGIISQMLELVIKNRYWLIKNSCWVCRYDSEQVTCVESRICVNYCEYLSLCYWPCLWIKHVFVSWVLLWLVLIWVYKACVGQLSAIVANACLSEKHACHITEVADSRCEESVSFGGSWFP